MELKKHFEWRYLFVGLYVLFFGIYIIVGLQPVQATNYVKSAELEIPSIGLVSDVAETELKEYKLETPDEIVGSFTKAENKTLLIGHSTTVFQNLDEVKLGDEIIYDGKVYTVKKTVWSVKERVHMGELIKREKEDTLVIMTCAGEMLRNGDATHRLIITASIR
ncbi:sortase [Candidatus Saccharibacteria bacterium]|nr:sortase [Candidatus Saccharibacteria bacterium]